ncbi:hypothetical protein BG011_009391 [Mortierella polycephala]|uniref:SUZ domain-containing protein n=1 Tax=Mortierella polycephala TaxID=41804 RepID=A0A9P6TWL8_9FUNG|nr:hypothetical protein BG011_009391 [Mortierella polycephala]
MRKDEHKQDWVSCAANVAVCTPDLLSSSEPVTAIEHDAPQLQSLSSLTAGSAAPLTYTNDKHEGIDVDNDESSEKKRVDILKEEDDDAEGASSDGGLTRRLAPMQIKESCTVQVIVDSGSASSGSCCSLDEVLLMALKRPQERMFLLKLDHEFCSFIENPSQTQLDLPWLNSYYRMMIHRSADYFQLARKVNTLQKKITLSKTEHTAIPTLRFCDLVEVEEEEPPIMPIKVLRRYPARPASVCGSGTSVPGPSDRRNVTIEQREKAYAEARKRIFQEDRSETDGTVLAETDCPAQPQSQGTPVDQPTLDGSQGSTDPTTLRKEETTALDSLRGRSTSSSTSSSSGTAMTEASARPDSATYPNGFQGPDYASGSGYSPPGSRHSFASGYDHFHRQAPPGSQLGSSVGAMDHRGAAGFHCDCRHDSGHQNGVSGSSSSSSSTSSSTSGIIRQNGGRYPHHPQGMHFNPVSDPSPTYFCQVPESNSYQCPCMIGAPPHTRQFGHPHDPRNTHCGCLGQHHQQQQQHHHQGVPQQQQQQQQPRGDMGRRLSSSHSFVPGYQQTIYHHSGSHVGCPTQGSRHDRHYYGHHQHHPHYHPHPQHPHHPHHHHHYPQHHHPSNTMDTPPRCCDYYHPESRSHQDDTYSTDTITNTSSSPSSGLFQVSVRPYPSSNGYRPYRQGISLPQLPPRQQQSQQQEGQSSLRQRQQRQTQFQMTREQQHHHSHHHQTHPHPHPQLQPQQLQPRSRPQQQHAHSYESHGRTSSSSSGSSSGSSVSTSTSASDSSISTGSTAINANATAQQNRLSWRMRVAAMAGREEGEGLQQVIHNVERRPPKSTELYDPYA